MNQVKSCVCSRCGTVFNLTISGFPFAITGVGDALCPACELEVNKSQFAQMYIDAANEICMAQWEDVVKEMNRKKMRRVLHEKRV